LPEGPAMNRCTFLTTGAAVLSAGFRPLAAQPPAGKPGVSQTPTRFQIACMTLPYSRFPLQRALDGIKAAGYSFVAWGTTHNGHAKNAPVVAADAPPDRAKELAKRCRGMGLEPVMMFSGIYPEAKDGLAVLKNRLLQAGAAGVPQVLTFGHTKGGNRKLW